MAQKKFNLQAFLPYQLNQAAEATSAAFERLYKAKHRMNRSQWRVLAHLGEFGALTATEICSRSRIEKTRVSRAVASLEKRKLLKRRQVPHDRRAEILELTARGQRVHADIGRMATDHHREILSSLGKKRAVELAAILNLLLENPPQDSVKSSR